MKIQRVTVDGYRSLNSLDWPKNDDEALGRLVVLYGLNGTGKSNLLAFLDLVLNAPSRDPAPEGLAFRVKGASSTFAPHLGRQGWIQGSIEVIRETSASKYILNRYLSEASVPADLRKGLDSLQSALGERESLIRISIEIRELEREGTTWIHFNRLEIDGKLWVSSGDFIHDQQKLAMPTILSKVLGELTRGFVYLPCPREVHLQETLSRPIDRNRRPDRFAHEPLWWQRAYLTGDIAYQSLGNLLYWARLDPAAAELVKNFERRVERYLPHVETQYVARVGESETIRLATSMFGRARAGQAFLPTALLGTGVQQLLYILAARYLLEAPIIAVDELEANLSPQLQQALWDELARDAELSILGLTQVLVASHSPVFLLDADQSRNVDVFYVTRDIETKATSIKRLRSESGAALSDLYHHFNLYSRSIWKGLNAAQHIPKSRASFEWQLYDKDGQVQEAGETGFQQAAMNGDVCILIHETVQHPRVTIGLGQMLSLDEWLNERLPDEEAAVVSVEWTAASKHPMVGTSASYRVEVAESSDSAVAFSITIELRLKQESIRQIGYGRAWSISQKNLTDRLLKLRQQLKVEREA